MKKIIPFMVIIFLSSCTSNTIFEKPKNLISKDTMSLLIQEMFIASSAKNMKNINLEKKINYMPFVYDKYKIDSVRFQNSSLYYVTEIDEYQSILNDVKEKLEKQKEELIALKNIKDSIRKDSIKSLNLKTLKKQDLQLNEEELFIDKKSSKKKTLLKKRKFNKTIIDNEEKM